MLFILLGVVSNAQYLNSSDIQVNNIGYNETYRYYTGTDGDTTGTGDLTWSFSMIKTTKSKSSCNVYADIDTIGAPTGTVSVILEYRTFPEINSTYIPTDTVVYSLTVDTAFTYTTTSTYPSDNWRARLVASEDAAKVKIDYIGLKIFE